MKQAAAPSADILIVDDERYVREVMTRFLALSGYSTRMAHDVPSARREIEVAPPALVFLDINMPGTNGLDFLKGELAPRWPEIAVVISSAVGDLDTAMEAVRAGAADYIQKPVSMALVQLTAARALERRRLVLENREYQERLQALVDIRTAQLREKAIQLLRTQSALVHGLCRLSEHRDAETGEHLDRMAVYAQILAERVQRMLPDAVPADFPQLVRQAAPLHDIGKVGIPDSILLKTGTLDDGEFDLIKRHTIIGAETLDMARRKLENDYAPFLDVGAEICLGHHERWDGRGYPHGRRGEEIPISARVAAVADYFDACTSSRVYRPYPMLADEVRKKISENSGKAFDPLVVRAFLDEETRIYAILADNQSAAPLSVL